MVVQTDRMGNGPKALQQGRLKGRFRHMQGQPPGTQIGTVMGGHRKVQHHLLPSLMGLLRKPGGVGGMGQEGVSHLPGQVQDIHCRLIAHVINDDADRRLRFHSPLRGLRVEKEKEGQETRYYPGDGRSLASPATPFHQSLLWRM